MEGLPLFTLKERSVSAPPPEYNTHMLYGNWKDPWPLLSIPCLYCLGGSPPPEQDRPVRDGGQHDSPHSAWKFILESSGYLTFSSF